MPDINEGENKSVPRGPIFVIRVRYLLTADRSGVTAPTFHPEFGRFMLEATPGKPWGIGFKDLLDVEHNMKWRSGHPHRYRK